MELKPLELSPKFREALLDAEHYHHTQARKGTQVPYVSHLLGVCSIALEAEANEDEAIAALLHDAPEDAGGEPTLNAIEAKYGRRVGAIVRACSDALPAKGEKKEPWLKRKKDYLGNLQGVDVSVMLVSASDKLHNLRAIRSDYLRLGDELWERFNAPVPKKDHILWYYASLMKIYADRGCPKDPRLNPIVRELGEILNQFPYDSSFQPA